MSPTSRQLSNGMWVRIISDPGARCAAALFQVNVGSQHEPDAWPGLAHLLEHVLFSGSVRFQDDARLMSWLPAQGGRLNASTRGDSTAFFFECPPALLADALTRLSDMLAAPLLADDAIRQESTAIDAEYRLLSDHAETLAEAAVSAAFQPHPCQRFQVGDSAHFGTDGAALAAALRHFHRRAYYAGNITLWLQGPQTADELWLLAEAAGQPFAAQGEGNAPLPPLALAAARDYVMSRPGGERLRLSFLLSGALAGEITLLRQLLQDEAEGSLMAALRAAGLCDGLHLLLPYRTGGQTVLSIELKLIAPQHAARAEGLLHHWLRQLTTLSEVQLRHYAGLAVRQFTRLPVMDQLRERAFGFAPPEAWPLLARLLAQLVVENMTRLYSAASAVTEQPPLSVQGFRLALAAQTIAAAKLPSPAPQPLFFPRTAPAYAGESGASAVALPHDSPGDGPAVLLLSPPAALAPRWGVILQAGLRELAGNCAHEGGELRLACHQGLWLLQLHGSDALISRTLAALTSTLAALPAVVVEQGEREYRRQRCALRADIAVRTLMAALAEYRSAAGQPPEAGWTTLPWQARLFGGRPVLHQRLAQQLTAFPAEINPPGQRPPPPLPLPDYGVVTDSAEAALVLFCPLMAMTPVAAAAFRCLALCYQPAFFQQMRVEKNVGYAVGCRFSQQAGQAGMLFFLQSPTLDRPALWACIDSFLQRMTPVLEALTPAQLAAYRGVLQQQLDMPEDDPLTASREHWLQLQDPTAPLTQQAIGQLTREDLLVRHQQLSQHRQHWWRLSNTPLAAR